MSVYLHAFSMQFHCHCCCQGSSYFRFYQQQLQQPDLQGSQCIALGWKAYVVECPHRLCLATAKKVDAGPSLESFWSRCAQSLFENASSEDWWQLCKVEAILQPRLKPGMMNTRICGLSMMLTPHTVQCNTTGPEVKWPLYLLCCKQQILLYMVELWQSAWQILSAKIGQLHRTRHLQWMHTQQKEWSG